LAQLLGDLLKGPIKTAVDSFLRKGGELLRLLASAFQPLRNPGSTLPLIAPAIQDDFSDRLQTCLNNVLMALKEPGSSEPPSPLFSPHRLPELLLLLIRLLQFNLGFRGAWTAKFQAAAELKLALLIEIIVVSSIWSLTRVVINKGGPGVLQPVADRGCTCPVYDFA
jgi:hypothetical protein